MIQVLNPSSPTVEVEEDRVKVGRHVRCRHENDREEAEHAREREHGDVDQEKGVRGTDGNSEGELASLLSHEIGDGGLNVVAEVPEFTLGSVYRPLLDGSQNYKW